MAKKGDSLPLSEAKAKAKIKLGAGKGGYNASDFAGVRPPRTPRARPDTRTVDSGVGMEKRLNAFFDGKTDAGGTVPKKSKSKASPSYALAETKKKSKSDDSYAPGTYGGRAGKRITQGVGGAFKNR